MSSAPLVLTARYVEKVWGGRRLAARAEPVGEAWVVYDLPETTTVQQVSVYWFDDTGRGRVRVPAAWTVQYRDGDAWRDVQASSAYTTARDRDNVVSFAPVRTNGLRLRVTLQPDFSAGIQEWSIGR